MTKLKPLRNRCWKTSRKLKQAYLQGEITIDYYMKTLPYYGAPKPTTEDYTDKSEFHKDYDSWRNSNLSKRVKQNLTKTTKYDPIKAKVINNRPKAIAARKKYAKENDGVWRKSILSWSHGKSMVSKTPLGVTPCDFALHHVNPYRKKKATPFENLNDWQDIFLTVPMTCKEHHLYHGHIAKQFGRGVYPTPINWPVHFIQWVKQYRLDNNIPITGGFQDWPALCG